GRLPVATPDRGLRPVPVGGGVTGNQTGTWTKGDHSILRSCSHQAIGECGISSFGVRRLAAAFLRVRPVPEQEKRGRTAALLWKPVTRQWVVRALGWSSPSLVPFFYPSVGPVA